MAFIFKVTPEVPTPSLVAVKPDAARQTHRWLVSQKDGFGGPDPGQRRDPDCFPVRVLVHSQFGREHREQNNPQWIPVPGHSVSVSYLFCRRLPPAVVAGMGSPQNGTAEQVLPMVHPASSLREILRLCVGSLQHMEGARLVRTHRWVHSRCWTTRPPGACQPTWWCVRRQLRLASRLTYE